MPIRAAIWDFSGVLLKPRVADPHAFIARELGMDPPNFAKYFDGKENARLDLGEESEVEYYQRVICEQNLKEMDALRIFNRYFFDLFDINEELMDFIRAAHPRLQMAICSNFSSMLRSLLENKWKIINDFDVLVISSEVRLLKPDPRIYQLTLDELGVKPEEAVFVDDTQNNVLGAQALGIIGILYEDNHTALREIEQLTN
jgi:epoxide hydrolase-like predicted phosphatase